jgi:hypothetical protein
MTLQIRTDLCEQLKHPDLFIEDAFIGGTWLKKSGTFAVTGMENVKVSGYIVLIRRLQNHLPGMYLGRLRIATWKISRRLLTMHIELSQNPQVHNSESARLSPPSLERLNTCQQTRL